MLRFNKKWLTSPLLIFAGILSGLLIGIYNKPLAEVLSPIGELYLILMSMCILPIIVTAIVSSIGKSLQTEHLSGLIKRLVSVIFGGLFLAGIFGVLIAFVTKPGVQLSGAGKDLLSKRVPEGATEAAHATGSFFDFISQIIPSNIFNALSQGNTLAVVFFAILLGVALGKITTKDSQKTLTIIHVIYIALLRIVTWIMYGLPIGLCFLFTGYAAKISLSDIAALAKLVAVVYGAVVLLVILLSILIWKKSRMSYARAFSALKTPLLVAFGSSSSFASIPAMINGLEQHLRLDRSIAELVVPLGVNLFRPGIVLSFSIAAIFVAQLYGLQPTFDQLGMLVFVAVLASFAVSGMPGVATAGVFAFVLQPLEVPSSIGMILYITILPVLDPIITLFNVQSNCTLAMLMKQEPQEQLTSNPS